MEVKFEAVRIGEFRNNHGVEFELKNNYDNLKSRIKDLVSEISSKDKDLDVVCLVIPGRGSKITIYLNETRSIELKNTLTSEFPNSVYRGNPNTLLENVHNRLFPVSVYNKKATH